MAWSDRFSDPIQIPDGSRIETLRDAGAYIARLPNCEYKTDVWRTATHLLIEAAEGTVSIELARFAILQAFACERKKEPLAS
ncbi:hypothetical protein E0H22_02860 [Rhodopseudomonas boonkerdii]|uniref:hypothetical protein n=1 Tax=Rhodopseudomonas boonkerdii TaxID=475937 RepID=UPI001E547A0B|nr:hypothetical protein [Rhodopseudomonas boonkerdii]UGV24717.1 hypothetical protein E0H22_02860 [Rhodopseudomonas boonkerdii]